MPTSAGPDIVQDGLVLELDAADRNSYTSGSATWRDLSGNNYSGSLVNGPAFSSTNGGSIVFDGVDDYVMGTGPNLSGSAFTISVWINPTVAPIDKTYFSLGSVTGTNTAIHLRLVSNSSLRFGLYANDFNLSINPVANNWNCIVCSINNSLLQSVYQNGVLMGTRSASGLFIGNNIFSIGAWGLSSVQQYIQASIPITQIYNRELSASEILQNYKATKTRFGL